MAPRFVTRPPKVRPVPRSTASTNPHWIADSYRRHMASAVVDAADHLVTDQDALVRAVASGSTDAVDHALALDRFAAVLEERVRPVVERLMAARGGDTLRRLFVAKADRPGPPVGPPTVRRAAGGDPSPEVGRFSLDFRLDNPYAIQAAQTIVGDLITRVSAGTVDAVRQIIEGAIVQGLPPRQAATLIMGTVGLDPRRATALERYRAMLAAEGVPGPTVDRLVTAYSKRLLKDRALTIARTETIRASSAGTQAAWHQAIREGLIDDAKYGQQWSDTGDRRTCPQCQTLAAGPPIPFGALFPGGYSGPPAHTSCRCDVVFVSLPAAQKGVGAATAPTVQAPATADLAE